MAGGIVALQVLDPAEKDPAVVTNDGTVTVPPTTTRTPVPTTAPPSKASPSPTSTGVVRPAVTVLNNSRVTGLAAKAARDFASGGWTIAGTGNLGGRLAVTTVYFSPGQEDAAAALRKQFPAIRASAPRYAGLPGEGGLTVVVTRDYPS